MSAPEALASKREVGRPSAPGVPASAAPLRLPPAQVALIVATIVLGLVLDLSTGFIGQAAISLAVWLVLAYLLHGLAPELRASLMACLVIATLGEMVLSLVFGLYVYRLDNIPPFVPPGHVLLLMLGLALAQRLGERAALVVIGLAGAYAVGTAVAGIDTLGLLLFALLAGTSLAMPHHRRLYASTFLLALALELLGTQLGNWAWARTVPGTGLVTTNPPVTAGAFYCALDALVAVATLHALPRWRAWRARARLGGGAN